MDYASQFTPSASPSREKMIRHILDSGNCFYHAKGLAGLQFVERRTTAILLQPNDFLRFGKLDKKIEEAAKWPLSSFDFPIIEQLSKIRADVTSHDKMYIVLALYMYLADLVTIYPNQKGLTFLEACRRSGFLINDGASIRSKFEDALENLGLTELCYIPQLVEEWEKNGTFKITGLPPFDRPAETDIFSANGENVPIESKGVYSVLARTLALNKAEGEFSPVMLMNNCIAYVQYVKDSFQYLGSEEERLEAVLRHATISSKNPQLAMDTARRGHDLRRSKLKDEARTYYKALTQDYDKDKEGSFFSAIFSELSDDVIAIYHNVGIEIIYSEAAGLSEVYPQKNLPGYDDTTTNTSRNSKGLNLSRFKIAMFSNDDLDINLSPEKKFSKLLHTISHEAFHIASGSNGVLNLDFSQEFSALLERRKAIYSKAPKVFANLSSNTSDAVSSIIDTHMDSLGYTFRQIIDISYYKGYPRRLEKIEEMLCNLYGLTQVELASKELPNPLNSENLDLREVQELAKELQGYVHDVAELVWQNKESLNQQQIQR